VAAYTGPILLSHAPSGKALIAVAIYAASLSALLGVSALYHRVTWSPSARSWMGRLDHTMIYVLIVGTYTPVGLLTLTGKLAIVLMVVMYAGSIAGIGLHLLWVNVPRGLSALVYVALGWSGTAALPQVVTHTGWAAAGLLLLGGILYSAGAAIYALRRPDPIPAVFGYHEVFHALVVAAAAAHYAVVAMYILPAS
jgi:hemolysin III